MEATEQHWNYRTLDRNYKTRYHERLLSSQQKAPVEKEMREKTSAFQMDHFDFIKDPYVLDDLQKPETDNPTIGTLLCTETDKIIAKYSVLNQSKQLLQA